MACKAVAPSEVPALTVFTAVHFLVGYAVGRYIRSSPYAIQLTLAAVALHIVFEYWESTPSGVKFFNNSLWDGTRNFFREKTGWDLWCNYPGDSAENSAGDNLAFIFGLYVGSGGGVTSPPRL